MTPARRILVVGAGGSGIPLAARLAEAGHDVHLLEAGPDPLDVVDPAHRAALQNAWTVNAGLPDGPLTFTYEAEIFDGRPWRIARGRVMGGSTAVNGAYFQRPVPADFAAWEREAGPEWGFGACLPALKRLESDHDFAGRAQHGASGPVPVARAGAGEPVTEAFLHAATAAGATWRADKNDGSATGVGLLPRNAIGAERWGVWRSYEPLMRASGVHIHAGTAVQRVVFENDVAIGVTARDSRGEQVLIEGDEVILASGALETPRLLFASGIGDASALQKRGVPVVVDAPAVGRHLSDHPAVDIAWRARPGVLATAPVAAWTAAWNEILPGGAAVELLLAVAPTSSVVGGAHAAEGDLDLRVSLATPLSRGLVEPAGDVVVRYGYLTERADAAALAEGVRLAASLLSSPAMGGVVEGFDEPDSDLDGWIRRRLGTSLHSCGTARMSAVSDGAVTDPHGRVRGVGALRVADASILPTVPSRGTALAAVMIGERIAELMATETRASAD